MPVRSTRRTLAFLLYLALPASASAQGVSVRVIEAGVPVQGVLLTLLDTNGTAATRALSNAAGEAVLRAEPGRYRIRAELIGRAATETEAFDIAGDALVTRTIVLTPQPVALEGIAVDAASRCEVRPAVGRPTEVVWNEARKALEAEQLGRAAAVYRFDIENFVRELDPRARRVLSDRRRAVQNVTTNPFRSRPAEELAERGYLRETETGDILYAPTPDVLLSDPFLDTHCFHLVRGDEGESVIGLAFEPIPGRSVPDVAGVLWLAEADAALLRLEFRYEGLPARLPAGPYGGEATFRGLPSGIWIVETWSIRAPVVGVSDTRLGAERVVGNERLLAIQEEGAEVVRIRERGGRLILDAERATVTGAIEDESAAGPLADAVVALEGTTWTDTTDARGRFRIAGVPGGDYRVTWSHARLARSGYLPDPADVRLEPGRTTELSFVLPRGAELVADSVEAARVDSIGSAARALGLPRFDVRAARPDAPAGDPVRVLGRVLDENGRSLEAVSVTLPELGIGATTSGSGRFTLAAVPPGRHVLHTSLIGYAARADTVELEPGGVVDIELRLATRPIELPPISVEARSRWLAIQGFYDRRNDGLSGHVITRADIERQKPVFLQDLLDDVPGVRLYNIEVGRNAIRFARYVNFDPSDPLDGCEPQIWLDGQRYMDKVSVNRAHGDISRVENLNFITPEAVEAIEIYVGNPPIRFNHPCGAILIWTRRGG